MRSSLRFVLFLLCCMFAHNHAANVNAQYLNPKVKDKKVTIRSAVLLPATALSDLRPDGGAHICGTHDRRNSAAAKDGVAQAPAFLRHDNIVGARIRAAAAVAASAAFSLGSCLYGHDPVPDRRCLGR